MMEALSSLSPQTEVMLRVLVALVLGGIIGFERELADRPAGMRTHMLVCAAACLLVGLADALVERFYDLESYRGILRADPIRIVEAVVTGVAFLGAGTIFRYRDNAIEGLTTAASLLLVAAIGIAVATGQFVIGVGITVLVLLVLSALNYLERYLVKRVKKDADG